MLRSSQFDRIAKLEHLKKNYPFAFKCLFACVSLADGPIPQDYLITYFNYSINTINALIEAGWLSKQDEFHVVMSVSDKKFLQAYFDFILVDCPYLADVIPTLIDRMILRLKQQPICEHTFDHVIKLLSFNIRQNELMEPLLDKIMFDLEKELGITPMDDEKCKQIFEELCKEPEPVTDEERAELANYITNYRADELKKLATPTIREDKTQTTQVEKFEGDSIYTVAAATLFSGSVVAAVGSAAIYAGRRFFK